MHHVHARPHSPPPLSSLLLPSSFQTWAATVRRLQGQSRVGFFCFVCLFVCLSLTLIPLFFGTAQISNVLRGRRTRRKRSGERRRPQVFLKSSSPKWEVTICQRVVSVLVVPCQTVGPIIRARGRQESRVNELVGNLESRYHTLAPQLLIKTVTLISGYEKIHKTECSSVRQRKQSHRRSHRSRSHTHPLIGYSSVHSNPVQTVAQTHNTGAFPAGD